MKMLAVCLLGLISFSAGADTPAPTTTCVDLNGNYDVPGRHPHEDWTLNISQDQCQDIRFLLNEGGIIPIGPDDGYYRLNGKEGYQIVNDTIINKNSDGSDVSFATHHGYCSAKSIVYSLDANKNLVVTSNRIYSCDDGFKGPFAETFTRIP